MINLTFLNLYMDWVTVTAQIQKSPVIAILPMVFFRAGEAIS